MPMSNTSQRSAGRLKSSIVLRLNTRLFFRLLGIYLGMDLLLIALSLGGLLFWAEHQCADLAALVEERGIPSAETSAWMAAGDYTITALDRDPEGYVYPFFSPLEGLEDARHTLDFHGGFATGSGPQVTRAVYTVELTTAAGEPYAITLDIQGPVGVMSLALRILLVCQALSLLCNLFKNAGTIRKTLKPIQELAAAARTLGSGSAMSPEELQALAGKLDQINATHLDRRISVPGTQKELQTLAAAINAMLDRINAAYRSQMRFVSDASHELRTPIAVIQGYANLLNRWGKDDPETRQEAIDAIRGEADSMKELVEQLLFLARGDNDSMHIEMETFDLTAVAAEVFKETEMIDQTHRFSADWQEAVPVQADVGLTKQALRILVDNAIKYTPAGGRITLSVRRRGDTARLSVQDEGQGIDAASLPHIFDRFYRTDESRTRQTGGTGLGLSIAKWIVERHGGWFEVDSWVGVGTRMTVVLPLDPAASHPQDRERTPAA